MGGEIKKKQTRKTNNNNAATGAKECQDRGGDYSQLVTIFQPVFLGMSGVTCQAWGRLGADEL